MTTNDGNATGTIQSVSREARLFPPSKEFTARALINDAAAYEKHVPPIDRRPGGLLGRDGARPS